MLITTTETTETVCDISHGFNAKTRQAVCIKQSKFAQQRKWPLIFIFYPMTKIGRGLSIAAGLEQH